MSTVLKYQGFEILCKKGAVLEYRAGKKSLEEVLLSEDVYKDANKRNRAKQNELAKKFPGKDTTEIIKEILENGNYNLTTAERKEFVKNKRNEIIHVIKRSYVDAKTKLPIPVTRIESALDEIKPIIDPFQPADKQAQPIIKKMMALIPMKYVE